jgi:energy-coupling factor transporter transmembrane protein EcfT
MLHLYYLKRHIRSSHPYTFNIFHKDTWLFFILLIFLLNKKYWLHVAHCIISVISFLLLKCTYIILSRLFQFIMSLTYAHVLFNWAPRSYGDLVQKIINRGASQCKMWVWKNALAFIMWKNHNRMIIIP